MANVERLQGYSPNNKNSVPFLIAIQGVDKIAIEDTMLKSQANLSTYGLPPGVVSRKYFIQYAMTLYNDELKTHLGFFGRTFNGNKLELVESLKKSNTGETLYRCEAPEFVFFHSSFS